jgi:hypothetical protein
MFRKVRLASVNATNNKNLSAPYLPWKGDGGGSVPFLELPGSVLYLR